MNPWADDVYISVRWSTLCDSKVTVDLVCCANAYVDHHMLLLLYQCLCCCIGRVLSIVCVVCVRDVAQEMSDLLTDYALAFLKEREAEELRAQSLGLQSNNHRNTSSSHNGHVPPPPQRATNGHSNGHAVGLLSPSAAAVRIQALYRGFALRNDWAKEDAAILIQAVYRGYRARVLISKLIEDMIQSGQL